MWKLIVLLAIFGVTVDSQLLQEDSVDDQSKNASLVQDLLWNTSLIQETPQNLSLIQEAPRNARQLTQRQLALHNTSVFEKPPDEPPPKSRRRKKKSGFRRQVLRLRNPLQSEYRFLKDEEALSNDIIDLKAAIIDKERRKRQQLQLLQVTDAESRASTPKGLCHVSNGFQNNKDCLASEICVDKISKKKVQCTLPLGKVCTPCNPPIGPSPTPRPGPSPTPRPGPPPTPTRRPVPSPTPRPGPPPTPTRRPVPSPTPRPGPPPPPTRRPVPSPTPRPGPPPPPTRRPGPSPTPRPGPSPTPRPGPSPTPRPGPPPTPRPGPSPTPRPGPTSRVSPSPAPNSCPRGCKPGTGCPALKPPYDGICKVPVRKPEDYDLDSTTVRPRKVRLPGVLQKDQVCNTYGNTIYTGLIPNSEICDWKHSRLECVPASKSPPITGNERPLGTCKCLVSLGNQPVVLKDPKSKKQTCFIPAERGSSSKCGDTIQFPPLFPLLSTPTGGTQIIINHESASKFCVPDAECRTGGGYTGKRCMCKKGTRLDKKMFTCSSALNLTITLQSSLISLVITLLRI